MDGDRRNAANATVEATIEGIAARVPATPPEIVPSREEIAAVAVAIAEQFRPRRVVLFGSRAYGTPRPDSDVDLMVVVDTTGPSSEEAWRIRTSLDRRLAGRFQIHVRTPERIRIGLAERDFFIRDAMLKGVTLVGGDDVVLTAGAGGTDDSPPGGTLGLKQATRDWLGKADADCQVATRLLTTDPTFYDIICFHAQQCVEKALKALLQQHEIEFSRTHDLVALAALARPVIPTLASYDADFTWLSTCAVEARYPAVDIDRARAADAVRIMTEVRAIIGEVFGLVGDAAADDSAG